MPQSKLTNVLLAIIAGALVVIALRPAPPSASATLLAPGVLATTYGNKVTLYKVQGAKPNYTFEPLDTIELPR